MKKTYEILGETCIPLRRTYVEAKNTAIELQSPTGESITIATVNLDEKLPEDQAFINTYAWGHETLLEDLQAAGIVKEILGYAETGFVTVAKVLLDLSLLEEDEYSRN